MNIMNSYQINEIFSKLSTPLIADAIVRLGSVPRVAPPSIQALMPRTQIAGRVLPVKHYGSVDVFFEAMSLAQKGDILVIDNQGRMDEGCIGDLTALEARAFEISGMIVWGCHRDTRELIAMGFPIFSFGAHPFGPLRVDQREADALSKAQFGEITVTLGDVVFADDDGVIFVSDEKIENLLHTAIEIKETEQKQVEAIASGQTLHKQLQFDEYLRKRNNDSSYTFREHLRVIGGAIEE